MVPVLNPAGERAPDDLWRGVSPGFPDSARMTDRPGVTASMTILEIPLRGTGKAPLKLERSWYRVSDSFGLTRTTLHLVPYC